MKSEKPIYTLHYAPDNASLIVRLVLEEMGVPYTTQLVQRSVREQDSPEYRALNPVGLIPVLETPDGPIFETGAIVLWLSERHAMMAPAPGDAQRGHFLKWLFFTSNTLHADLRMLFVPRKYAAPDPESLERHHDLTATRIARSFRLIDTMLRTESPVWLNGPEVSVLDCYLALLLRWSALYPKGGTDWFDIEDYPALLALAERLDTRPAGLRAAQAEGLGPAPFSSPSYANPPEGSPT